MTTSNRYNAIPFVIILAALLNCTAVRGFDTGHHYDIVQNVLSNHFNFSDTAIHIVQVQNWLTDYISQDLINDNKGPLGLLHFDNLFSTQEIIDYWNKFAVNTKNAINNTVSEDDPIKTLTIIGITLHAVQDFYTHSNFTQLFLNNPSAPFPQTWWHNNFNITSNSNIILHTGYTNSYKEDHENEANFDTLNPHGGYDDGLNKDSYVRPGWKVAYTLNYVGTVEWVNAIITWIGEVSNRTGNPSFLDRVKNVVLTEEQTEQLQEGLELTYRISEYVDTGPANFADGHWKGDGSGNTAQFAKTLIEYYSSDFVRDSVFFKLFDDDKLWELISFNLEKGEPAPAAREVPQIPFVNFTDVRVVLVRILYVDNNEFNLGIDSDFYTRVTILDQEFVDAVQNYDDEITPYWTSIKFLPPQVIPSSSQVNIVIQQWEEDPGGDDQYDINPEDGKRPLTLSFNVITHQITGDVQATCDSVSNPCVFSGCEEEDDSVTISFYITSFLLNETLADGPNIPKGEEPSKDPECPDDKRRQSPSRKRRSDQQFDKKLQQREFEWEPPAHKTTHKVHPIPILLGVLTGLASALLILCCCFAARKVYLITRGDSPDIERADLITREFQPHRAYGVYQNS